MKISVNGKSVFELSEIQKQVICNDIPDSIFEKDMERRLKWVLEHKYERCLERLKKEWEPKLKERVSSFPTKDEEFAQLVFSQPDYKSRQQKIEEGKLEEHKERTGQN
jgi:hypothetical protein